MVQGKQLLGLAIALYLSGTANADFISGTVWSVPAATASNAPTLGHTPGPSAIELATFTATGINFDGDAPGAYNLGGFLNSNGSAGSISYVNGASAATSLNNTEWEFTGTSSFTNGQTFNVMHDDGVNMYVGNVPVLLEPDPTAPVLNSYTYNGNTGDFAFDFIYVECCFGSAEFRTNLATSAASETPEPPSGFLLVGSGLALYALGRARKKVTRVRISR